MCTSSLSSNVTIIWSHNGVPINESATTNDTSILTVTSVKESDAGSYVCTVTSLYSGFVSVTSNNAILTIYGTYVYIMYGHLLKYVIYVMCHQLLGPPVVTDHPSSSNDIPAGRNITLICRASSLGTLVYSWERSSGSSWTTVSNDNTTSYTTDTTLAIGPYMYRCRVSNDAGSVVSNNAIVNVYGEYCPNM